MTFKRALLLTWVALVAGIVSYAVAQQSAPNEINGCIVVGLAPTYTAGQRVTFTCNTSGQLRMSTTP
jgi:hypothetical protein